MTRQSDTSACITAEAAKNAYHVLRNDKIKTWKPKSLAKEQVWDQNGSLFLTLLWMMQEAEISISVIGKSPGWMAQEHNQAPGLVYL